MKKKPISDPDFMVVGSCLDHGWDIYQDNRFVCHCETLQEIHEAIDVLRKVWATAKADEENS